MRSVFAWTMVLVLTTTRLYAEDEPKAPVPAKDAPQRMTLPPGFKATLFAGEPDVVQPIALCFDDRGRLWVAECLSYPKWVNDPKKGGDRITILEDTNHDGVFDKKTVFHDKIPNLSGLTVGHGGVWACSTPNLLFIPDKNGDDVPDGPPEVVLEGWDLTARHNVFNAINWGPDGWLYGCNGILSKSRVGPPGSPIETRPYMDCGVWRYHPVRKEYEVVATGTTNPWGLDWDDYGQMFITNCVIEHVFHFVPGGRYKRMFGEDPHPHTYALMGTVADHIHWAGGNWTTSRGGKGAHSDAGGGHAHAGCMIYLGDMLPKGYRNGLFTCNIHGNRVNHDFLEHYGSSYKSRHAKDFMYANDPWFRGLYITYGPDGGVYVTDWTDTGECHNYVVADGSNGRVFKLTHGTAAPPSHLPLRTKSDAELVALQSHTNDWYVRHARRLLHERALAGKLEPTTIDRLNAGFLQAKSVPTKLRYLWALHVVGGLNADRVLTLLRSPEEWVRSWAVTFALETKNPSADVLQTLVRMADKEASPKVRLTLASQMHRLPVGQRHEMALPLAKRERDASDEFIPLMVWYGIEPTIADQTSRAFAYLDQAEIPLVREFSARRVASLGPTHATFNTLLEKLGQLSSPAKQRDVLRGIQAGIVGVRQAPQPAAWVELYPKLIASSDAEVRERALELAVVFGDMRASKHLHQIVEDASRGPDAREKALKSLLFQNQPGIVPALQRWLADPALRSQALKGLAGFEHPESAGKILQAYPNWNATERSDALQTLASRPSFALTLLDGIAEKKIPRTDVSAFTIRQLLALKDAKVTQRVEKVWGQIRPASQDKLVKIKSFKDALPTDVVRKADLANGRALFQKHCQNCHQLFGEGGQIGPELTGSQRASLEYILENVLDPSAIVPREYQVSVFTTDTGRVVTGIVKSENDISVTVQTQNEVLVLPKKELEARVQSPMSMMPEGLFGPLRLEEVRDLVGYLASPTQVPLRKGN